ncbi:MAG: TatD family deoxyribonuclease [Spirochaetales bacterium]|nr:MAG: TatD family deoxyribonuclease [Spirochaetales bacterium]
MNDVRLVDVHCHLESDVFGGRLDSIVSAAKEAGIVKLITSSIVPEEWALSESIARRYDEVEFALGIHPWYGKEGDEERIAELAHAPGRGAVAIGEIGLDKKTLAVPLDLQKRLFERQLAVAREIDLPVIVHCRGAFDELHVFLKKTGLPARGGVIHSYSGSVEIAVEFMKYGFSFSFGGVLTYRNSKKKESVLRAIYPDHFMLETDSPDIPPVEARDAPNVPANIVYNLRAAAEILGESEERVAAVTTANAARMFGFSLD